MKKRLILIVALLMLVLSTYSHADNRGLKLELNNEEVLMAGDMLNIKGTTYVDCQKLSRVLGYDFISLSGGRSIVLRTIKDGREHFLYFNPQGTNQPGDFKLINRGGESGIIDRDLKSIDYMTTEMYDKLEEDEARKQRAEKRLEVLKDDYEKVVGEDSYILKNNAFYVPVKSVAKAFHLNLKWDPRSSSVLLYTKPEEGLPKRKAHRLKFTEEDVKLLAKIATVEAGGGSENKLLAICNVVLNRVENPYYPSTIRGVIYQSGQFPPVYSEDFKTLVPYQAAVNAAYRALYGENNVPKVLYFNMEPFEDKDKSELFGVIEGEYFYY